MIGLDNLLCDIGLQRGDEVRPNSLQVVLNPLLLGLREAIVQKEGSGAEVPHFLGSNPSLLSLLPLAIDVVPRLHGLGVFLDELEEDGDVVDLEVAAKLPLLLLKLELLLAAPFAQQELALVSDLHVAEALRDLALHSLVPLGNLDCLAST